jgi:hypothetical protein
MPEPEDVAAIIARRETILARINRAFERATADMYRFTEVSGQKLAAEYPLTVRIAEEIAASNHHVGFPLKVHLEQSTRTFATNCFPFYQTVPTAHPWRRKLIPRERRQTKRPGNIDVAVLRDNGPFITPVCAIEVKRLNPSEHLTLEDLERNAEYFSCTNQLDQRSTIEFTVFATLHKYQTTHERHRKRDERKASDLYNRRAKKIRLPRGVTWRVSTHPVEAQLLNDTMRQDQGEALLDEGAYLYLGISIVFLWEHHTNEPQSA